MALPIRSKCFWQALFIILSRIFSAGMSTNHSFTNNEHLESNENFKYLGLDKFPISDGNTFDVSAPTNGKPKLCVFCYPGQDKKWYRLWTNPKLTMKLDGKNVHYHVYYGENETEVKEKTESSVYLPWPSLPFIMDHFAFYPFNATCIGISSEQNYSVHFTIKNPELLYIGMAALGFVLFFSAASWSRNVALHYSVGVSLGVVGSFLIFVFIIMKFVPEKLKTLTYILGAVSTSVSMFLYHYIGNYLNDILRNNWKIVCCYVLISGIISFALVYRYGPVTNPRSLDLVKWTLQIFGLALVYQSTQIPEMSIAIILMALAAYHVPHRLFPHIRMFRFRYFPPKRRLLTEEEYQTMGDVETKKALDGLRSFCRSPDCNAWKTVSRLTSPNKFAEFMEGDSHISDGEFEIHVNESEVNVLDLSKDSSDEEPDTSMAVVFRSNGIRKDS